MILHHKDRDGNPVGRSFSRILTDAAPLLHRDVTKFDYAYQLQRLQSNANRISRRMRKAAMANDIPRMEHLAKMLVDTQGKAMVIMDKIGRLKNGNVE